MQKILVIQTAFIGDVVLATAVVEKIIRHHPDAQIDFLVRKGNETLLLNNPHINEILVWDKKHHKKKNLFQLIRRIRKARYDKVVNLQRFAATGLITALSGAKETIGFDKNPFSFLFKRKIKHEIRPGIHEVDRNLELVRHFTGDDRELPRLYPSAADEQRVGQYRRQPYITITPSSVWFTKHFPVEKWVQFLDVLPTSFKVFLLGGKDNVDECNDVLSRTQNTNVTVLAGELSFLQSAALMKDAAMNYVNDSAPLHFASAVNAPVTAVFCSTVPEFGFTPLSELSYIVQTREQLACKPCGLHGRRQCPLGHFKCAHTIEIDQLLQTLPVKPFQ